MWLKTVQLYTVMCLFIYICTLYVYVYVHIFYYTNTAHSWTLQIYSWIF